MGVFAYKAVDERCRPVAGTISADTPRQARDQLRARGLRASDMVPQDLPQRSLLGALSLPGRSRAKVTTMIRELATLLGVGIPLLESLDTICRQHQGRFRTSLLLLRDRISAGAALAEAMADQPQLFDPLCVHMVEVGENAGTLDQVLAQLADFKERWLELKDRVLNALLYPIVVLLVSVGVTIFLMTAVVPMLLRNLLEAGRPLPWPTQVLKALSDVLLGYGWWLLLVAGVTAIACSWGLQTAPGRRWTYRVLLRLPLAGTMARKQTLARISLVIATLLRSGITFLKAVEIAGGATRNLIFREALAQIVVDVGAGREIGPALERTKVFPPLVVRIFSVGQQTGQLEDMLERLAVDYDRQVSVAASRLASALEPVLILFLAVIVGFILFATVLPILEAGNVL